ncbi:MAG: hypothetical protein PSV36_10905 [Algoriphagus sp.]|nr:hypothetical protein [Algoriphagus sp.]
MENHEWEDEIIEGIRGQKRAEPNPFLFTRIEAKLGEVNSGIVWNLKMKVAVSLCAFTLLLNSVLIIQMVSNPVSESLVTESTYQVDSYQFEIY